MDYKLGLLGLGTVGTGVAQILQSPTRRHPLLNTLSIHRVGVRSLDKQRDIDVAQDALTTDLQGIVSDTDVDIVVELIGGIEPARTLILEAIARGKHVVTANKAVIAAHGTEIAEAAKDAGVCVAYEAAVGGGIPIVQPLQECLGANVLLAITGIVNGTTNFILDRMTSGGESFDAALAEAQALGYAEADPTADVDGLDAADKIAILASLGFNVTIDRAQVFCEGIRHITADDIRYARDWGFEVKLLATAQRQPADLDTLDVRVHPTLLPFDHPLANVHNVNNAVLVRGEPLGEVMFFGPGAGRGATASAVVADVLNTVAKLTAKVENPNRYFKTLSPHQATVQPIGEGVQRYYARVLAKDRPGVIGAMGQCFGNYGVSLEMVMQKDVQGDLAEVVVLTHNVLEANFQKALQELEELPEIASVPTTLRVLPD